MPLKEQQLELDMNNRLVLNRERRSLRLYVITCLFNLYAEYFMRNTGPDEAQAGIKVAGRNINNLRYADDTTLMAERETEQKSLLMKVKEESEKIGWKLNIKKKKLRSWHIVPPLYGTSMGKQWKQWQTLFFGLQSPGRWLLQPWN